VNEINAKFGQQMWNAFFLFFPSLLY